MDTAGVILFWLCFGAIGYVMANNRGRNPIMGVVWGVLFGLITVVCYWIAGDTTELRVKKANRK
jgi:hypothetical protein